MPILEIIRYPNPILKEVSAPIERIDEEIAKFIDDLVETMRDSPGCALASVQLGKLERIIVVEVGEKHPNNGPRSPNKPGHHPIERKKEGARGLPLHTGVHGEHQAGQAGTGDGARPRRLRADDRL